MGIKNWLVNFAKTGPTAEELAAACQDLRRRAAATSIPIEASSTDSYPILFAGFQTAKAKALLSSSGATDGTPLSEKRVLDLTRDLLNELKWTAPAARVVERQVSMSDGLSLIWEASRSDAACALEQIAILSAAARLMRLAIMTFVALIISQYAVIAIRDSMSILISTQPASVQLPSVVAAFASQWNELVSSTYVLLILIAFMGALFGTVFDLPAENSSPHWQMVRLHARRTRLWSGACIGLLTAAIGPVLLGSPNRGTEYAVYAGRLYALAFIFGFSQELFLNRLQSITMSGKGRNERTP